MNRLPSPRPVPRPCPLAALFLLLIALPSAAFAQKTAAPPPAASFPAPAAPPAPSQKALLDGDSRLDRLISLDVISVPLGEVLQKESLDRSTEKMEDGKRFLLTIAPECADLKMQIRLNNRPLRVLMQAFAQMVPGVWTRTPHGYQFSMTAQAVSYRSEWWHLFLGEREKALVVQHQAVLAAMQTKAHRRQIGDPDPEQSDRAVEEEVANQHDFFPTLPQALKEQIAANMDDNGFYEMDGGGVGNTGEQFGTFGWLSQMPPETQEKFKVAMQDDITNHLAPAPPAFQKYAVQAQRDLAAFDPSRVYFWFLNGGFAVLAVPVNGPRSLSTILSLNVPATLSSPALSLDQTEMANEVYGGSLTGPGWKQWADKLRKQGDAAPTEWKHIMYLVYGMGDAAPPEWKQLAAYQHARIWPNILPKLPPENHHAWQPTISRAAKTDWLGEQGHMEYVSDYYSQGGYAMPEEQKKLPVKRPLATELNEIAAKHDVSWAKDTDGVYLVRNNRWYRDDGLEVPEPLLRQWFNALLQTRRAEIARREAAAQTAAQTGTQAKAQTPPGPPQTPAERRVAQRQMLDWGAEVFSTLTPWQIRNGLARFQPEEKDLASQNDATAANLEENLKHYVPQGIVPPGFDAFADATRRPPFLMAVLMLKGFPRTIQLYGSLTDAERTALLGGRLPIPDLNTSQLAQATALQPFLPQAMQSFPPDSVFLGLSSEPRMRLEISTPAPSTPPSAP